MNLSPFLQRAGLRASICLLLMSTAASAWAMQSFESTLPGNGVFTRSIFDFGTRPWVDDFSPAQTGAESSSLFAVTPGISGLLTASPSVTLQFVWDPTLLTPLGGNTIIAAYLGGGHVTATLPGGSGAGPLVLSNEASGLRMVGVINDGRAITPLDLLMLPGSVDAVSLGMSGSFAGAGLEFGGTSTLATVVDLLDDPMFRASYNGSGSLESLSELRVRIQPSATRVLAEVNLGMVDSDGDALSGTSPPGFLSLDAFGPLELSLRFTGSASASLHRDDYSSSAAYDEARSFWGASGFRSVGIEQFAGWQAAPVPEPGAWALMLAGLAALFLAARRRGGALAAIALATASSAQAAEYRVVDVAVPGMATVQVWDVNNLGQVAGSFSDGTRQLGFVWSAGSTVTFEGPPGATAVTAFGVSDAGHVVGSYSIESTPGSGELVRRAWLFDGHAYSTFAAPTGVATEGRGISPDGRWMSLSTGLSRAYLLDRLSGALVDTSEPGDSFVLAQGINLRGQHVGSTGVGSGRLGYVYDLGTGLRTETSWHGLTNSSFRDINNLGQIAGWAAGPLPGTGTLRTVGVLGMPSSPEVFMVPGSMQTVLQGINDAGWISGTYRMSATGPDIGFVAMPIPEPGSWAMLATGLVAMGWWSRRRIAAPRG